MKHNAIQKDFNKIDKFVEKCNICIHLYSKHYSDYDNQIKYLLFDQINLAYPKKFLRVNFTYSKIVDINPYKLVLLEIIKVYDSSKNDDLLEYIYKETKTDKDIIEYILADFMKNGLLVANKSNNGSYIISAYGLELVEKRKKREIFQDKVVVEYDMIQNCIGYIYEPNNRPKVKRLNKIHDVELEYKTLFRPDKYALDTEMPDGVIYRKRLIEELQKFYVKEYSKDIYIESIDEIEVFNDRTYDFYHTLFFTNKDREDKLLVIDDSNKINEEATKELNRLQNEGFINLNFSSNKNKEINSKLHDEKKQNIIEIIDTGVNTTKNNVIKNEEHPHYLIEAFKTAVSNICIISPWVRYNVLEKYKDYLEEALRKGIDIHINYGISKTCKNDIDRESKCYFNDLKGKYKNLYIANDADTHAKILICDDKWVITGSFNWLSYDGYGRRGESSILSVEKNIINKFKQQIK